ncbi:MAG: hypothetical protein AB2A00_21020 [Myxococcota bacterium]
MRNVAATLGVVVILGTGCPRVLLPSAERDDAGPRPHIEHVTVAERSLGGDGGTARPCAYAGDTLVVTGGGWDVATVRLRVGSIELDLEGVTTEELRAVVPADLPEGEITVLSGPRASEPYVQSFCYLGVGHPPAPSFIGEAEPRLVIMASGVGSAQCAPINPATGLPCGLPPNPDGGVLPVQDPACRVAAETQGAVAVTFGLGSTFAVNDPIYQARVYPLVGYSEVGQLPALRNDEFARLSHAAIPYASPSTFSWPDEADAQPGVLVHEGVTLDLTATHFRTHLLGAGQEVLNASTLAGNIILPYLLVTPEKALALGVSSDGVGFAYSLQAYDADGPGEVVQTFPGELPLAAGVLPGSWLAAPGLSMVAHLSRRPLQGGVRLRVLLVDATTGEVLPEAQQVGPVDLQPCAPGDEGCARCASYFAGRGEVASETPMELVPFYTGAMVAVPMRPLSPVAPANEPVCAVFDALGQPYVVELTSQVFRAVTAAALPDCNLAASTVAVVPRLYGEPRAELWMFNQQDTMQIVPTRTMYAALHVDPVTPTFYAIPESGGRVDVLDRNGTLVRSASVLGAPWDAWPMSRERGGVLVIYPTMLMHADSSGQVLSSRLVRMPYSAAVETDERGAPAAVWAAQPRNVQTVAGTNFYQVDLLRYDVTATGADFGKESTRLGLPDVWVTGALPRVVTEEFALVHYFGVANNNGNACQQAAVGAEADWVELVPRDGSSGTLVACNALQGLHDPVREVLYIVEQRPGEAVPFFLRTWDVSGGTPVELAEQALFPMSGAILPGGGLLGVFFKLQSFSFELGLLDVDAARQPVYRVLEADAPFSQVPLVASPDGRRLYAGTEGNIIEFAIEGEGDEMRLRSLSQVKVAGTPVGLRMDPQGTRLVYVTRDEQTVGLVE